MGTYLKVLLDVGINARFKLHFGEVGGGHVEQLV